MITSDLWDTLCARIRDFFLFILYLFIYYFASPLALGPWRIAWHKSSSTLSLAIPTRQAGAINLHSRLASWRCNVRVKLIKTNNRFTDPDATARRSNYSWKSLILNTKYSSRAEGLQKFARATINLPNEADRINEASLWNQTKFRAKSRKMKTKKWVNLFGNGYSFTPLAGIEMRTYAVADNLRWLGFWRKYKQDKGKCLRYIESRVDYSHKS